MFHADDGAPPHPARRDLALAARTAARLGVQVRVVTARGDEIARIGPETRSVAGWLLTGSPRLKPRLRGIGYLLMSLRRRAS